MLNWNDSYNWTHDDYYNAIRATQSEGKSEVSLDTEHCSAANERQLVRWAQEDGYRAVLDAQSECVTIYIS